MKVIVGNNTYVVKWQHHNVTDQGIHKMDYRYRSPKKHPKSYTLCWIESGNKVLNEAKALLHDGDRYQKDKGRKVSLKLALGNEDMPNNNLFSKHERALFWEEYLKMTNKIK